MGRHPPAARRHPLPAQAARAARAARTCPPGVELLSPDDLGIDGEPDETGLTFETNARIKARYYAARSGLPTLADDSGLEVDALGGGPGVRTRRYAGPDATDADNNAKLLARAGRPAGRAARRALRVRAGARAPGRGRAARRAADPRPGAGRAAGGSPPGLRGDGGFGYDPLFEPPGEPPGGRTLGQWSAAEKHAISHRARAAARMAPVLRSLVEAS